MSLPKILAISAALLLFAGCFESRPQLSAGGQEVRVSTDNQVGECAFLEVLVQEESNAYNTFQENVNIGTDVLRNRTWDRGGTDLVLDPVEPLAECRTCVLVSGRAYRCSQNSNGTVRPSNGSDATVSVSNGEDVPITPNTGN